MNVYIVLWFDRHTDPYVRVFRSAVDANDDIERIMRERYPDSEKWVDSRTPMTERHREQGMEWVWQYPAMRFVTSEYGDGPHGYILNQII